MGRELGLFLRASTLSLLNSDHVQASIKQPSNRNTTTVGQCCTINKSETCRITNTNLRHPQTSIGAIVRLPPSHQTPDLVDPSVQQQAMISIIRRLGIACSSLKDLLDKVKVKRSGKCNPMPWAWAYITCSLHRCSFLLAGCRPEISQLK